MSDSSSRIGVKAMEAAAFLRDTIPEVPPIALVLGSGLSALAEGLTERVVIPFEQVPHFPAPTVPAAVATQDLAPTAGQ